MLCSRHAAVALLLCALAADAHIVYGTKTLHGLVSEADLVLHARILAADPSVEVSANRPGEGRPAVEASVLEVLKGEKADLGGSRIRFVQHGHGVARFEPGEASLLFLIDIARSRELDALGRKGAYSWVSLQEHDDRYPLVPGTRDRVLGAVRAYVAADTKAAPNDRIALLRGATRDLLTSGDAQLASSALRDLVLAPTLPLVNREELPALEAVLDDSSVSMGVRVGLLSELERRGLVEGEARWARLLSTTIPTRDRVTAIRAAGTSGGEPARKRLIALLSDPDPEVAAAAAVALGKPGNADAVEPLAASLSHAAPTVRLAAIRGLGGIGSAQALGALESAAASHPDPATRRRARAETRKRRP